MNIAVILGNMGGPNSLNEVEAFLTNIFRDPAIIDIPAPAVFRHFLARKIAASRLEESKSIYRKLGGKTPLNELAEQQAQALSRLLSKSTEHRFTVYTAMRYWRPLLKDVWAEVRQKEYDKIIFVSMYPFYSTTTTGSFEAFFKRINHHPADGQFHFIDRYSDEELFVAAVAEQINDAFENSNSKDRPKHLLFSAHSIPFKRIRKGDPYEQEVRQAVEKIKALLPPDVHTHLAFQSKVGPVKWLSPATDETIRGLAAQKVEELFVYPLGFVADNSETVYEIGMLYKELAEASGIRYFHRIEALNTHPRYMQLLEKLVLNKIGQDKRANIQQEDIYE